MKKFDIGYHAKVMFSGFVNALYGVATAGLIGLATFGFISIPSEGGYVAVCDFIGAVATLVVALASMYAYGNSKAHRKHCRKGEATNHK